VFTVFAACDASEPESPSTGTAPQVPQSKTETNSKDGVEPSVTSEAGLHALTVTDITGKTHQLSEYAGKPLLIVNTASECGFTNQYKGLQELHATYGDRGLRVLAFPSNDFGSQEPGSNEDIAKFVTDEFGVQFSMFSKLATKGGGQAELYKYLTTQTREDLRGDIKWNFTKFLVDGKGNVVSRFESPVEPMDPELTESVEALLGDLG
jgi:glutathione peroxidase